MRAEDGWGGAVALCFAVAVGERGGWLVYRR
jgi:hypothetical protein